MRLARGFSWNGFRSLFAFLPVLLTAVPATRASGTMRGVPSPYPTIQQAIQAAGPTDTVLVEPGVYEEVISFLGKEILVGSRFILTGDPAYVNQTVIDPGTVINTAVVYFIAGEGRSSRLSGFTVRGGTGAQGGGIYCDQTSPTLDHLWITENHASSEGGGIYAHGGGPRVSECRITDNQASGDGGGISTVYSWIEVVDCEISRNLCGYRGGGMFCEHSSMTITGNTITDNVVGGASPYNGGGITSRNCDPLILNNFIARNDGAGYGGGIFY